MMIMGIKEVMELLGCGRPTAERIARQYLGKKHRKGMKFIVPREHFLKWVSEGMQ